MTVSYRVRVEPLGTEVLCREDQTVLDACLRDGVWLPHACTHGTCGTCKAQVFGGEVDLGDASAYALLESERDAGLALLCVAKPRGDVIVEGEIDVEEGVDIHPVRDYSGTVDVLADVAPGVRRLIVGLDAPIQFNPGQYIQLNLPSGDSRPYSIASSSTDPTRIELHIKLTPGGAATDGWIFHSLREGDAISISGPYGMFSFRPLRDKPVLLLGSGTGLAPLKSICTHIVEMATTTGWDHDVVLYHGVSTRADLYDRAWFEDLQARVDWFSYRPAVSRANRFLVAKGEFPELLLEDFPRASGRVAYICGNPAMVEDTLRALMKARLFPRDILRESFFDTADRAAGAHAVRSPLIRR